MNQPEVSNASVKNLGISRRSFLKSAAGASLLALPQKGPEIRIEDIRIGFQEFLYRSPYKFGGVPVDRATILNVTVSVRNRAGSIFNGMGSMPLGNVWAFPSKTLSYNETLQAMKLLAERIAAETRQFQEYAHPIEINHQLEPGYLALAAELSKGLKNPIPKLAVLVTASPFDAALHDAFGKSLKLNSFSTCTSELMRMDLSRYLNGDFKGEELQRYINRHPVPQIPIFHSVGGSDAVLPSELTTRINDGLPETLGEWISFNGLKQIKIKLQGEDLKWDIERTVAISQVATETRPGTNWKLSVDFNERCPDVGYVLEYLRKVKERSPIGFERILYLEQPTARDLKANRQNVMHEAAKLRPVVIDESLTDLESLLLAREMGYTGVALKACKGQSQAVLMAAAAQKYKMFLCVQDLTCPGASLIHSAGIASHIPGVSGIEANSRQYMPAANERWKRSHRGIFEIKDGIMTTEQLEGPGLSAFPS